MTTNTEAAYAAGQEAYYRGDGENPHDTWSPQYREWSQGWVAAGDSVEEYAERPDPEY